jgi:hypothetical protein
VPKYPFIPKSTSYLEPGHYWSIPLSNDEFTCGVVLQLILRNGKKDSRLFICGLMNWSGPNLPVEEELKNCEVIAHGQAHIKSISKNNGEILGKLNWENSKLEVPLSLSESPGRNCRLQRGYELLGIATPQQQKELNVFATWGLRAIVVRAEKYFVKSA